jgi:hypothetical protein
MRVLERELGPERIDARRLATDEDGRPLVLRQTGHDAEPRSKRQDPRPVPCRQWLRDAL